MGGKINDISEDSLISEPDIIPEPCDNYKNILSAIFQDMFVEKALLGILWELYDNVSIAELQVRKKDYIKVELSGIFLENEFYELIIQFLDYYKSTVYGCFELIEPETNYCSVCTYAIHDFVESPFTINFFDPHCNHPLADKLRRDYYFGNSTPEYLRYQNSTEMFYYFKIGEMIEYKNYEEEIEHMNEHIFFYDEYSIIEQYQIINEDGSGKLYFGSGLDLKLGCHQCNRTNLLKLVKCLEHGELFQQ